MKVEKKQLHPNEVNALTAIAKSRVPQMIVLYDPRVGGDVIAYISLN